MIKQLKISILLLFVAYNGYSQYKSKRDVLYDIKVRVVDTSTREPIKDAVVSINGIVYQFNFTKEYYPVKAMVDQELTVVHPKFENVYYRIKSNEEIKIEVEGFEDTKSSKISYNRLTKSKRKPDTFFLNLDSANFYKKRDIGKSLSFIENILKENYSKRRNAATYRLLGDIYFEWQQYDLAITNYQNSLQYTEDESTKLQLVKAIIRENKIDEAEKVLLEIITNKLGLFQKILVFESLGDIYLEKKNFEKAEINYQKALKIAEENRVPSKVTDLNSKLGDVSAAQGNVLQAGLIFQNSINLASKENAFRSLEEKEKVANFYNTTQQFDKEIDLRKETLKELNTQQFDGVGTSVDSITTINGNANFFANSNANVLKYTDNAGYLDPDKDAKDLLKLTDSIMSKKEVSKFDRKKPLNGNNSWVNGDDKIRPDVINNRLLNSINTQSINYKIGRALVEKEDYKKAIPFLESSIKAADKNNDLIVKKDATRKLSEVYDNVGDYDKALTTYKDYISQVDSLYVRKVQEIAQANRFSKRIGEYQNRIASLEKNKALNDSKVNLAIKDQQLVQERNKNQQVIIYSLLGGMILMFVLASLLLRSNKQQKLANNLLALKSMRSQMNPHFIFNALNSVNSFIAVNDERNANRYLSEFSVLMRSVLENSDEDFIPFSKEVELLELYVKLEHNRFREKFDYTISVDESIDLEEFSIPPMLLQPYIENAIWHGLRYKEEKGTLEINVKKVDNECISVVIQDDGVGRKKSKELKTKNQLKQKSKGMSTIQNRINILNDMYQDRIAVEVSDFFEDGTGTKVELLLKKK